MPSSYDGDIKLSVSLSTADVKQQAKSLQKEIEGIFDRTSGKPLDKNFQKLQSSMSNSVAKATELEKKLSEIENAKVPTQEYTEIQKQISKTTAQLNRYRKTESKMLGAGDTNSKKWATLQSNIEEAKNTINAATLEMQGLDETGQAFTIGGDPDALDKAKNKLADMNNQMRMLVSQANKYESSMSGKGDTTTSTTGTTKAKSTGGGAAAGQQKYFKKSFTQVLKYSLAISMLFRAIDAIGSGLAEGITNVSKFGDESNKTAQSVNSLQNSLSYLKNAWGAAFAPIINFVTPALVTLMDALAKVSNFIAGFLAALTGRGTYIKAVKQQTAVTDAIEGTGAAAEEASGKLADFDELNIIGTEDSGGGGGGIGDVDYDSMFQTVSVSQSLMDVLDKIKQLVSDGFWDGFGDDWKERVAEIQKDCASIQASLTDIFTDPAVVSSANQLFESFFYNLGRVAGSVAGVGLTIGEALVGGIEVYLSKSSGFLKQALSGLFSDAAGLLDWVGFGAQVAADILSVFSNQWSQNIVGMIFGTVSDAILTAVSLMVKQVSDFAQLIVTPIADNAELIKTAISQLLQAISTLLTPVFAMLQSFFSWMLTAYDTYISPFMTALAGALSQLLGGVLTELTTSVLPNLISWTQLIADKLNQTWTEVIQPILTAISPLIEKIFEVGKNLWDTLLSPLLTFLTGTFSVGLNAVINVIGVVLVTAIELLATTIDIAGNAIIGVIDALTTVFNGIVEFINGVLLVAWQAAWDTAGLAFQLFGQSIEILVNGIVQIFSGIINFLVGVFTLDWSKAWNGLVSIFQGVVDTFGGLVGGVLSVLISIITFIRNTFMHSWSAAWNGVKDVFRGVWNGIASICESVVNGIIRALNRLSFNVPSWIPGFGGKKFGFNLSTISIPRLAEGAVIPPNKEFLAVLGDQKSGTNVETPLSTIEDAVRNVIGTNSISDPRVVQLLQELIEVLRNKQFSISKRDVGKTAIEYINSETKRTGIVPIKG